MQVQATLALLSRPFWGVLVALVIATGLRFLLAPALGERLPHVTYLLAVAAVALGFGPGLSLVTLVLGPLCASVFFSPPRLAQPYFIDLIAYVLVGLSCIFFAHRAHLTRARRDVAKRTDSLIENASARLAAIVSSSEDAIVSKDLNGIITTWNAGAERLFGYSEKEVVGSPVTLLIPEDHVDEEGEILGRIRQGEIVDHHQTVRRRKDGSPVTVSLTVSPIRDRSGRIIGASKIVRDMTERTKVHQIKAVLAAIVESSDDAIISKNLDGIITSWNHGAERLFGYAADEIVGQSVTLLIPEDRLNEELEIIGKIRRGEVVDHYETVRRRKDGTLVTISLTVSPIKDPFGVVIGASKVARDISLAKRTEEALRKSERQARAALEQAEAAARTKDEFLAILSHELRTPMTAILGWAQVLRKNATPGEIKTGIEVIERNARLQAQIIDDLLDMGRIASGKFRLDVQTVNVLQLLGTAVEGVKLAAEAKGVLLTIDCAEPVPEIRGDPSRLQQVFFNLLSNAVKFTPRGGSIQASCKAVNSHVEVAVTDTGAGISQTFLPHVFERFTQQDSKANRAHQGLGLGLAIVKHLVELHGGTVRAGSQGEGRGATFTIELPISVAVTPRAPADRIRMPAGSALGIETEGIEDSQALAGITVMVADDEPDARQIVRTILERRGARVLVCGSAFEALDRLQRHRPSVLLCDIGMPGVDGYELIARLRSSAPEQGGATPAIALTAFARSEDRTRSLLAGFQMHLSKPVEPEELVASIRSVASGSRQPT